MLDSLVLFAYQVIRCMLLYIEILFFFFYGDFVISLYHRHNRQIGGIGNVSNPLYGYARVEQRKFKY